MDMLCKTCLLILLLPLLALQARAEDELQRLRRQAAAEKTMEGYSAVCRYLYTCEEHPDVLALYADSIRMWGERNGSPACLIEYYAWKSEAAFIGGDYEGGYALKRKAIGLAREAKDPYYLSECCSDMGYHFNVDARYDSARHYFKEGMRASEGAPELAPHYRVMLTNYASSFLFEGNTDSALAYALAARDRSAADADTAMLIENYNQLGTIYRRKKRLDAVIANFEKALHLCEAQDNYNTAAYIYGNIATAYCDWDRAADALPFSEKAVEYARRMGSRQMWGICLVNLGVIQANLPVLRRKGIATLQQAVALLEEVNNRRRLCEAYSFLANAYRQEGKLDSAKAYIDKLDHLSEELDTDVELYRYYRAKAPLLMETGQYDEAAGYFRRAIAMLEGGYRDARDYDNYIQLAGCLAALHKPRQAYAYLHKAYVLRDSAFHAKYTQQLSDYAVRYQTKEKELEIVHLKQAQLEQKARMLKRRVLFGALVALLLIVLLALLYARQRQKMRMARLAQAVGEKERQFLELQQETGQRLTRKYIDGLESERQRMASELHDDVCNNLLALEMNVRQIPGTEGGELGKSLGQLEHIRQRLRNLSHELMPPAFQYANIDEMLSDYITHLVLPAGMKAGYTSTEGVDWNRVPQEVGFELYRIVQETVGNALKYSEASSLRVGLDLADGNLSLVVSDNGKGFEPGKKTAGVGLRTIRQRAETINARLEVAARPGCGTRISVQIRLR